MIDNVWEEVSVWQQHDEERNLEAIFKHELDTIEPKDLGRWFRSELKRREGNDS